MQIVVLSGKGGTGKTTVATSLAMAGRFRYADCDVEEPNGFAFLSPRIEETKDVTIPNPIINKGKCSSCGQCAEICQFNALAMTKEGVILFEKLCHGCGACKLVCPEGAIEEEQRPIGKIDIGWNGDNECIRGVLDIGEPMAGPVISAIKEAIGDGKDTVVDCSPGSSCNVVKAIIGSDYALLVTEPTLFGLHDLKLAAGLVEKLDIPHGVIINKADENQQLIVDYCKSKEIPVIASIPYSREAARAYSEGHLLIEQGLYSVIFKDIALRMKGELL